jgi:hypothetical protein
MRRTSDKQGDRRRRTSLLLVPLLACVPAVTTSVSAPPADKGAHASLDDVEAAYLYNFGKFVRWPESAGPMVICIAGPEPFHQAVVRLVEGERIDGRAVHVRVVESREALSTCSMLFVETAQSQHVASYVAATSGKPVLTVSDAPDFLDRGGIIQFILDGDHVRFAVNLTAASRNGLALSSELLKVAVRVTGGPPKGGTR